MANRDTLGGVIHTYQKYDPARFPSPTQPPPDLVSPALEHMLMFGEHRELTEEELARAIRSRSEPDRRAGAEHRRADRDAAGAEAEDSGAVRNEDGAAEGRSRRSSIRRPRRRCPRSFASGFTRRCKTEQIRDLERLWYAAGDDQSPWACALVS